MNTRYFQNGLVSLGGFIALAMGVKPLIVFVFAGLFWAYKEKQDSN